MPPELSKAFDRMCRHLNDTFITRGITIVDDTLRFINDMPIDVMNGGDIAVACLRGMTSISHYCGDFLLLLSGADPWEVFVAMKKREETTALETLLELAN